jgi:hypothetical protein
LIRKKTMIYMKKIRVTIVTVRYCLLLLDDFSMLYLSQFRFEGSGAGLNLIGESKI